MTRWFVLDRGTASPVVFVHGYPMNHRQWLNQIDAVSKTHRVLAFDLPGFGRTPAMERVTMGSFADGLSDQLDQCGVTDPIVLVGLSMGGYIALEFAVRHADRMRGLVFCHSRASADAEPAKAQRFKVAESVMTDGVKPVAEAMLPKLLAERTIREQPECVQQLREMMLEAQPQGIAAAQLGMAARHDFQGRLGQIRCPVLCIAGSEDAMIPVDEVRDVAKAFPHGEFTCIDACGHLSPMEQPERFNASLMGFLRQLK